MRIGRDIAKIFQRKNEAVKTQHDKPVMNFVCHHAKLKQYTHFSLKRDRFFISDGLAFSSRTTRSSILLLLFFF